MVAAYPEPALALGIVGRNAVDLFAQRAHDIGLERRVHGGRSEVAVDLHEKRAHRRQIGVREGPNHERKRLVTHRVASALRIACGVAGMSMSRRP